MAFGLLISQVFLVISITPIIALIENGFLEASLLKPEPGKNYECSCKNHCRVDPRCYGLFFPNETSCSFIRIPPNIEKNIRKPVFVVWRKVADTDVSAGHYVTTGHYVAGHYATTLSDGLTYILPWKELTAEKALDFCSSKSGYQLPVFTLESQKKVIDEITVSLLGESFYVGLERETYGSEPIFVNGVPFENSVMDGYIEIDQKLDPYRCFKYSGEERMFQPIACDAKKKHLFVCQSVY